MTREVSTEIRELLRDARNIIDGELDSTMPQYTALDNLCRALELLYAEARNAERETRSDGKGPAS